MSYQRRFHYYLDTVRSMFRGGIVLPQWTQGIGIRLAVVLVLIGVSLGYVVQISQTAVSGYEIHSLEKEVSALNRDTQDLSVKVAEYSSLNSIRQRLSDIRMVPAKNVNYIIPDDLSVVAKK